MLFKTLLISSAILFLSGCADSVSFEEASALNEVGFFHGLWHGLILLPAFITSLFSDNTAIYAIYNNGIFYDLGFVLGVGLLSFSSRLFSDSDKEDELDDKEENNQKT